MASLSTLPGRGTLLNALTVAVGGCLGWLIGKGLDPSLKTAALSGLGIITLGLGVKMFLGARNVVWIACAVALGGILGTLLGIQAGIGEFASWVKQALGAKNDTGFVDSVIATSVLFCVGPMTLLGCIQDRTEGKIELLAIKSTMDGIVALFFGATSGLAMLVTALIVLVVQGALTLGATVLQPVVRDEELLADSSATGGVILVAIAFGLLQIKDLSTANYIPALLLTPLFLVAARKLSKKP